MKRKKAIDKKEYYIVLNPNGEVFTGLKKGYSNWSYDWEDAKPLEYQNTTHLKLENKNIELIKEEEFYG